MISKQQKQRMNQELIRDIRDENLDGVLRLLKAGASPDATDDDGNTALMVAAQAGFVPCVKTLVEAGATLDAAREDDGITAIMQASFNEKWDVVNFLADDGMLDEPVDPNLLAGIRDRYYSKMSISRRRSPKNLNESSNSTKKLPSEPTPP